MKNYPILSLKNNFTPYKVYNATYLEELNKLVFSLFQYSEYQIPDFKEKDTIISSNEFDLLTLNFHNYYQLTQDTKINIGNKAVKEKVPAGTVIISYARAEGTADNHEEDSADSILYDENNYFFQPMGWGAYYMSFFIQDKETDTNQYNFIYDKYAEENYGRKLYFSFETFYTRYFANIDPIDKCFNNGVNSEIPISARNDVDKENYIIDRQGSIWNAYLTNPVMGFTFLKENSSENDNDYGEEIIIDSKWEVSTFDRSNIARYTIMSRENSKDWPADNHVIYAEII